MNKRRIDIYLVDEGYAETRTQAQRLVMAGLVLINEVPAEKSSVTVSESDTVRVKEKLKYVSRGALKLEKALDVFDIEPKGKTFIDFGASTGGFTDVLLQRGAAHVTCVDVGYGQLAWKIRSDERVEVMERTNARYLTSDQIGGRKNAAVCDVSFISVKKILPAMDECTDENGYIVILIKPQFEAGKEKVGKKGIVRDPAVHKDVVGDLVSFVDNETSFASQKLDFSPITGQKGNIEYLLYAQKGREPKINMQYVENKIAKAFEKL
jgi:23S rRNA (cytidine1920-2'-O)/16S rRNA (cytidine1409-2'-O)-methyltransferase